MLRVVAVAWAVVVVTVLVVAWRMARTADRREAMFDRANRSKRLEVRR